MMSEFLCYKHKPLVRCGDVLYYGDMHDKYVVKLAVKSKQKADDMEVADRVVVQLLSTDLSDPTKVIVKKGEQPNLFLAVDMASVWLQKALKKC